MLSLHRREGSCQDLLFDRARIKRVPWTARRSNQSILKEINPEYSLERLMLKLKLQYFGHLTWRTDSLEKTLMLEKIEARRRSGWQRIKRLDGITNSMGMSLRKLQKLVMDRSLVCCSPWGRKGSDMTEWMNWTELRIKIWGLSPGSFLYSRLSNQPRNL